MRCRTLALSLQAIGHKVFFAMQDLPGQASQLVQDAEFEVLSVKDQTGDRDGRLTDKDRLQTERIISRTNAACILVDHYGATSGYLGGIKARSVKIAVIDDMADRDLSAVGWLLNQNLGASRLPYRTPDDCIRLFGPAYALLRPEFARTRPTAVRKTSKGDRNVLLTLGGGDTTDLTLSILDALGHSPLELNIRCILGHSDPIPSAVVAAISQSGHDIEILHRVGDMHNHMAWADISINAGGSTCWELCCLGTPMIVMVTSQDQRLIASGLHREGCAQNLGQWQVERSAHKLTQTVAELLQAPARRRSMSTSGRGLVDGWGARRTAESLAGFST